MTQAREWVAARLTPSDLIRLGSSLVLALLLWGWVTTREDPQTTRTFANVTVAVGELKDNLVVVSAPPNAQIRLTGPRSVMNQIEIADVTAHLDLNGINKSGTYTVQVVVSSPDGVWQQDPTPARVQIQVEESVAKQFSIVPQVAGDLGSRRRVGQVAPEVSDVTVRGPSSVVARVDRVVLPVAIGTNTRDFVAKFTPVAQDKDGQQITEVSISPDTISATVPIEAAGKSIAVFTQLVGAPAQGLDVLDRAVNPSTVLVDGPANELDSLVFVQTQPVDITGATANVSRRIGLQGLPSDVKVIDPVDGMVEVSVQVGQRGVRQELPGLHVGIVNLAAGLQAQVSPDGVTVVVVASAEVLAQLTAADLTLQVDASNLGPGEHLLTPKVLLPPNVQWISTDPAVVAVTIVETATPAPSAASPVASPPPNG